MRLLVACSACQRQYDASAREPGSRFRCACGATITSSQPRGHDASVVRCSSCGAPRRAGAKACEHCHSDFTVHEQDLDTVCPSCLARVSDRARYCHHCAIPLTAEMVAGEPSSSACPACRERRLLIGRRLGRYPISVLECPVCVGLWLTIAELDQLFECESRQGPQSVVQVSSAERKPSRGYRPCAVCGELMVNRNFGGKSGVIVDVCGFHGIWFDADELSHLVAWTRAGSLEAARLELAQLINSKDMLRKRAVLFDRSPSDVKPPAKLGADDSPAASESWLEALAGFALRALFK